MEVYPKHKERDFMHGIPLLDYRLMQCKSLTILFKSSSLLSLFISIVYHRFPPSIGRASLLERELALNLMDQGWGLTLKQTGLALCPWICKLDIWVHILWAFLYDHWSMADPRTPNLSNLFVGIPNQWYATKGERTIRACVIGDLDPGVVVVGLGTKLLHKINN